MILAIRTLAGLAFTLACLIADAQKMAIHGSVKDGMNPLSGATVILLSPKDSSLVNFGVTDVTGKLEIKNVSKSSYWLKVTYVGYKTHAITITPADSGVAVDVGTLQMELAQTKLDEVVIQSEEAPVTVKKDTIEFNATTFKVNQNATVEDLLKKMPGIEVDNGGTIRAQGEQVQRITVDGKAFFGNDPKLATRNLPADAIKKVQVFDKKSDQTTFSGIDDGQREKTINLQLKPEKRNGAFGNIQGGAGSDKRFAAKANLSRFKKGQQLSFLGMANNINEQGFSLDDYMTFTGGAQQMMGGGGGVRLEVNAANQNGIPLNIGGRINGVMTNYASGLNFNKDFANKTELNSSYFFNYLDHDIDRVTDRVSYIPGGNISFNQASRSLNTNNNHRVAATLEHKIDSMNSLKWTNTASYNETESTEKSQSANQQADGPLLNESNNQTYASGTTQSLNSTLLWRHRFNKKGRTFSSSAQLIVNNTGRQGQQDATNTFYGDETQTSTIKQSNQQMTDNTTYGATLSYTEPLGNRKYLEGNYTFRQNRNDVDKQVYDLGDNESVLNTSLSNRYESDYQFHRAGVNFRLNRSSYSMTIGGSLQQTFLKGQLQFLQTEISRSYQNILPVARFNYDFSNTRHLRFDYETSVQEPTVLQLQPVIDNSDQLNWYIGNPSLRPAFAHSMRVNYTAFDPGKFISLFAFVDATYTTNAITTSQQYTDQRVRISQPVNVDHNTRIDGNVNLSFPIQQTGSRFSVGANGTHQQGTSVVEGTQSGIAQNTIGARLRYDYRYKEIFDASLGANVSRQSTGYEFNHEADQLFYNKTYTAEANLTFLKNFQASSSLEYLVYQNTATKFEQSIPLINLSISRFFLKAKSGQLILGVNNLLDKSVGVSQTADINYTERQVSSSLGRYYMITFIYALNKQLNPMSMRPRGGMIRITR